MPRSWWRRRRPWSRCPTTWATRPRPRPCSTDEKEALAGAAGADEVIRYTETDFAEAVQELTGDRGCDVVYDSVGQTTFEGSLRSLRSRGLLALYGQSSGAVPPLELQKLNNTRPAVLGRPAACFQW